ncbi:MAG: hypothetical protein RLZZ516_1221 [Cyanobacteriota bacterium]
MRIILSDIISLAQSPSEPVLARIASAESNYKSSAVPAALAILETFKSDQKTREFTSLFIAHQAYLELLARRDGSYVGWASFLFNSASSSGVGSDLWGHAILMGKELLAAAFIDQGETCIPFPISSTGCSLHAIGERLSPNPDGNVSFGNQRFSRSSLTAVKHEGACLHIDETHNIVYSRFVSDYSFPGGLKATPLSGPKYEDRLHKSDISAVEAGLSILRNSWKFGSLLVKYFSPSVFPVMSPSPKENISVSSEFFPGWVVVSLDTPVYMAECLIHEASHNLLYALGRSYQFVDPSSPNSFYSPWRPDPRPPGGLLHACFVFCNVIEMYYRISMQEDALELQSRYRLGAELKRIQICLDTLSASGSLTLDGNHLVEALADRACRLEKTGVGTLSMTDRSAIVRHLEQYKQNEGVLYV